MEREIGRGGMATVYLARDLRHGRNVAVKVLNPDLAAMLGVERFLAEIRVTANLQHPNILPLFDSGEAGGSLFYVMPFVEGESLRSRLERERQLPMDDAIRLTATIATGLDYAHRNGVVHRDLKPENVLLHEGVPMITDFGIALAFSNAGGERLTQTGLSLGTPLYMSPEQATGDRAIDRRTDIYSLGAMLYEMLAGQPPHTAATPQGVIAKVLTEKARDVRADRPNVPAYVSLAIDRALEKLAADRWGSAAEFADAITGRVIPHPAAREAPIGPRARWRDPIVIAAVGIAVVSLVFAAFAIRRRDPVDRPVARFEIATPPEAPPAPPVVGATAISPDGRVVVYPAVTSRGAQLYVRRLEDATPRPISGTEGGAQPMISPDGRWVAFIAGGKLQKVPIEGGSPTVIADVAEVVPGDWSPGNVIVVGSAGGVMGLQRVSANGGRLSEFSRADTSLRGALLGAPIVLDDNNTVLCGAIDARGSGRPAIVATTLNEGNIRPVGVDGLPLGVFGGRLIYLADDGVRAAPFDLRARRVTAESVLLTERVSGAVRLSRTGSLVFMHGAVPDHLSWIDDRGATTDLTAEVHPYGEPRLSPDGRFVAFTLPSAASPTATDIAVLDVASTRIRRVTNGGNNSSPEWLSDSKTLVYLSDRGSSVRAVWRKPIDEQSAAERIGDTTSRYMAIAPPAAGFENELLVSRFDGEHLVLETMSLDGTHERRPLLQVPGKNVAFARASPDGKWIAHNSNLSGRPAIYVRSRSNLDYVTPVSSGGDFEPVWSRDGRHLFYRRADRKIAEATVQTVPTFAILSQRTFVDDNFAGTPAILTASYDVSMDGKRLLVVRTGDDRPGITVITNWTDAIRRQLDSNPSRQP